MSIRLPIPRLETMAASMVFCCWLLGEYLQMRPLGTTELLWNTIVLVTMLLLPLRWGIRQIGRRSLRVECNLLVGLVMVVLAVTQTMTALDMLTARAWGHSSPPSHETFVLGCLPGDDVPCTRTRWSATVVKRTSPIGTHYVETVALTSAPLHP